MRKKMKNTTIMSRQIILSATLLLAMLLTMATATAQVFIMDDEFEGTMRQNTEDFGLIVPIEGLDSDQYLPLGDGLLVLVVLSGEYLMKKRKKSKR